MVRIGGVEYDVNERGVIDLTARYHTATYMAGGPAAWTLSPMLPVEGVIWHHWAGDYIAGEERSLVDVLEEIDACARHHRADFGIGPAYNLIVDELGVFAVGKHATRRAHTKGRNPATNQQWNVVGRAIAVIGDYESKALNAALRQNMRVAEEEVRSWPSVPRGVARYSHRAVPTVNSAGVRYAQGTLCPGRAIVEFLVASSPVEDREEAAAAMHKIARAGREIATIAERTAAMLERRPS